LGGCGRGTLPPAALAPVCERESVCARERERVCVRERERERMSVCVCDRERERAREQVRVVVEEEHCRERRQNLRDRQVTRYQRETG